MQEPGELIILGTGGHAVSVFEAASLAGFSIVGFVDPNHSPETFLGCPTVKSVKDLFRPGRGLCIGVGANFLREQLLLSVKNSFPQLHFPVIQHPSSHVSSTAKIGEGAVLLGMSFVGPRCTVGKGAVLNTSSSLDHDSTLKSFASLAPGARTGGNVRIGERSFIGMNTAIIHRVSIGSDTVIGAQSLVIRDVGDNELGFGTPYKYREARKMEDPYL